MSNFHISKTTRWIFSNTRNLWTPKRYSYLLIGNLMRLTQPLNCFTKRVNRSIYSTAALKPKEVKKNEKRLQKELLEDLTLNRIIKLINLIKFWWGLNTLRRSPMHLITWKIRICLFNYFPLKKISFLEILKVKIYVLSSSSSLLLMLIREQMPSVINIASVSLDYSSMEGNLI